jgi:DNA (cytosine-5)-methyltransferase 1
MKLGELCAGYGGLGMAVEEVFGAELAWVSEFDEAPSKILAHHWPDVPNHGDMTKIDWATIEPVDIISGGTPCQDLSAAGKRKGMTEGTRSNLWVNMREAIAIIQPQYVVWENVRGAYSAEASSDMEFCPGCMGDPANGGAVLRALGRVLGDLSDLGYDTQWRGLRAGSETNDGYGHTHVGSCHARFRVFVLATHRDNVRKYGPRKRTKQNWRGQLADSGVPSTDAQSIRRRKGWSEPEGIQRRLHAPLSGGTSPAHSYSGNDDGRLSGPFWESVKRIATTWSSETNWGEYEPAIRRWEFVTGNPAPRPTERTGRNNGERLSPRFTEWMMGLPDGWLTDPAISISRNEQLKACGNGVVPQQAVAALKEMKAAFESREVAA